MAEPTPLHKNVPRGAPREDNQENEVKASAATMLVGLLNNVITEAFSNPDGMAYVTIKINSHLESHPVHSSTLRTVANGLFFQEYKKAIASESVKSALNTIEFSAIHSENVHKVWSRVGHTEGIVWIDLGTKDWSAIRIDSSGWSVVPSSGVPIKFERTKATRPLPIPESGGSLEDLRKLFSIDDREWLIICAFMVAAYQPSGARAFLEMVGQSGSGKSSLLRFITQLVDPVKTATRGAPKDEVDLIIATRGRSILGFDNVSSMHPDMLDAYCRLSTGGGIGKRELHTDGDEFILDAKIPVIWTAIFPQGITRADFRQRTMSVKLNKIPEEKRRSETELDQIFALMFPALLGSLYDMVSIALRNIEQLHFDRLPRLADFALWIEAAGPGIGFLPGEFMEILAEDKRRTEELVIEASPIGSALVQIMSETISMELTITPTELLKRINGITTEPQKRQKGYPPDATRLSQHITRIEEALSVYGITVTTNRTNTDRLITISKVPF